MSKEDASKTKPYSFWVPICFSLLLALMGLLFFNSDAWYPVAGSIWIIVSLAIGTIWVFAIHNKNKRWFGENYRQKPILTKEGKEGVQKKAEQKKSWTLAPLKADSVDECKKALRDIGILLIFIGVLQAVIGFWLGAGWLFDAFLSCLLGVLIWTTGSVIVAYIFLAYSALVVIVTLLNSLGILSGGGRNVILALFVFWYALQSIKVTKKLRDLRKRTK